MSCFWWLLVVLEFLMMGWHLLNGEPFSEVVTTPRIAFMLAAYALYKIGKMEEEKE